MPLVLDLLPKTNRLGLDLQLILDVGTVAVHAPVPLVRVRVVFQAEHWNGTLQWMWLTMMN